jgi:hypothetical protein
MLGSLHNDTSCLRSMICCQARWKIKLFASSLPLTRNRIRQNTRWASARSCPVCTKMQPKVTLSNTSSPLLASEDWPVGGVSLGCWWLLMMSTTMLFARRIMLSVILRRRPQIRHSSVFCCLGCTRQVSRLQVIIVKQAND